MTVFTPCVYCDTPKNCRKEGTCYKRVMGVLPSGPSSAQSTIETREATHGDYTKQATITQKIKTILRESPNAPDLTHAQRETLDMIAVKLGRIAAGNPNEPDHWLDISGYSTLVHNLLTKGTHL